MSVEQELEDSPAERFNLVREPWILCRTPEGIRALSIEEIFDGTQRPTEITGDSPTQDYAVLRVLLAIFWRAHYHAFIEEFPNPRQREDYEWGEWFSKTRSSLVETGRDEVVLGYLEKVQDRFDLLSPTVPFMQVADLHTQSGTTQGVRRILPDAEEDYFTMRTGQGRETLSYAESARWLIHAQAFDYSGIKSGAVGDPRVKGGRGYPIGTGWSGMTGGTVIRGGSLLETLLLNTSVDCVPGAAENDMPVWERTPDTAAPRDFDATQPKGAADVATWQSRRIRLFAEDGVVTRVLVSNGDRIPDAGLNVEADPMTPYRWSKNKSKKNFVAYYPRPYDVHRTIWRGLDALVAVDGDPGFTDKELPPKRPRTVDNAAELLGGREVLDMSIVSMAYGPQNSTYGTVISASIGLPLHMLRDSEWSRGVRSDVRDAAERTGRVATAVGSFAGQLLVASGGEYEFGVDAAERIYAALEPKFYAWLRALDPEQMERELTRWQQSVRDMAMATTEDLLRGAGPKALVGRLVDSGSGERIVNAGSLYQQLRLKLDDELPLTVPEKKATAARREEGKEK